MNWLALATYLTLFSCVREAPAPSPDPADADAPTTPIARGSGVLRPGFDAAAHAPSAEPTATAQPAAASYTCPHHPEVVSTTPGKCPKCGMDLQPAKPGASSTDHAHHGHGSD